MRFETDYAKHRAILEQRELIRTKTANARRAETMFARSGNWMHKARMERAFASLDAAIERLNEYRTAPVA